MNRKDELKQIISNLDAYLSLPNNAIRAMGLSRARIASIRADRVAELAGA